MSGSCLVSLQDVREALPVVREWSGGPLGCPGVFRRPSRMCGVVGRLTRMSGSGRQVLPDVREWSEDPHGCPAVLGRPSQMTGSCRESLSEDWEVSPEVFE